MKARISMRQLNMLCVFTIISVLLINVYNTFYVNAMHKQQIEHLEGELAKIESLVELKTDEVKDLNRILEKQKRELEIERENVRAVHLQTKQPAVINYNNDGTRAEKVIFLTFDDGPSSITPRVLDILKESGVNATFFVVGACVDKYPEFVARAYKEGNAVFPHSYSHDYSIYSTLDTFYDDLNKAQDSIKRVLNNTIPPFFRFPGGAANQVSYAYGGKDIMHLITEDVKKQGYHYIEWNVSAGDATEYRNDKKRLMSNVLDGCKGRNLVVALFHDIAQNTAMVEVLPEIIAVLKEQGYAFKTFNQLNQEEMDKMMKSGIIDMPIKKPN